MHVKKSSKLFLGKAAFPAFLACLGVSGGSGKDFAQAWVRPGQGLGEAWLGEAWARPGCGLGEVWARSGRGLVKAWTRPGRGLGKTSARSGPGLGQAWARPSEASAGQGLGKARARLG